MKREYFLTTERLGFSWWTGEDLELANGLWEDPQVCRYICVAGQFSDDGVRERLALEMENGRHHHVQYWPVFELETGRLAGCCGLRPHGSWTEEGKGDAKAGPEEQRQRDRETGSGRRRRPVQIGSMSWGSI